MPKKILISAGEASGDLHAANLVKALHNIDHSIQVRAMGGSKLVEAGADVFIDCSEIAVVGIIEVLINYPKLLKVLNRMRDEVRNNPPDLLILVDYQEFNFKLAQTAKQCGVKVLFYISPQVWAWRPHRVHKMGERIDMMAVLFPFEEKFYKKANVPVKFVGNPLVDEVKPGKTKLESFAAYALDPHTKTIGLFPGSRHGEITRLLPILLQSAALLKHKHPELQFILPVASTLEFSDFETHLQAYEDLNIKLVKDNNAYDVMQICDAIITASGTATLEIALMGIPNVITYKISPISYFILKRMVTIENIGLVNIVAEKKIVQEFIQADAQAELLCKEIDKILADNDYRNNMIQELNNVKQKLGMKGGSDNVAQLAFGMLNSNSSNPI